MRLPLAQVSVGGAATSALLCLLAMFGISMLEFVPEYVPFQVGIFGLVSIAGLYSLLLCAFRLFRDKEAPGSALRTLIWNPKKVAFIVFSPFLILIAFSFMKMHLEDRTRFEKTDFPKQEKTIYVYRLPWTTTTDNIRLSVTYSWLPIMRRLADIEVPLHANLTLTPHGDTVHVTALLPIDQDSPERSGILLYYDLVSGVARPGSTLDESSGFSVSLSH
jgi:hypothetical protein